MEWMNEKTNLLPSNHASYSSSLQENSLSKCDQLDLSLGTECVFNSKNSYLASNEQMVSIESLSPVNNFSGIENEKMTKTIYIESESPRMDFAVSHRDKHVSNDKENLNESYSNVDLQKNSSMVTVFAIWNGMMGTSMLAMPWLMVQSGFAMGIVVFVCMTLVCVYTAYVVLNVQFYLQPASAVGSDFNAVMQLVLNHRWNKAAIFFSIAVMVGAMLVYWVLMVDFLYSSMKMFVVPSANELTRIVNNLTVISGAFCPSPVEHRIIKDHQSGPFIDIYSFFWNRISTAIYLALFLYPVLNIKNPTFFTKFTGLGSVAVVYMLLFVTIKAIRFGINLDFSDTGSDNYTPMISLGFPAAMGTLSLALFIHNCLCDIVRNNRHQENNTRDVMIAYALVFFTYLYIGLIFYISWPFKKSCIRDNILDNFVESDVLSEVGRVFLLFQLCTVFPLLGFIVRCQLMTHLYGDPYPSYVRVYLLNTTIVISCVLVAIFYPFIGQLTRFSGSLCGMAWIFTYPSVVFLVVKWKYGQVKAHHILVHSCVITLGIINFVAQFFVSVL